MAEKLNQALSNWFRRLRSIKGIQETSGLLTDEELDRSDVAHIISLQRYIDHYFELSDGYRHYLSIHHDPKLWSDEDKFPTFSVYIPKSVTDPLDFLPTSEEFDCINDSKITLTMKTLKPIVTVTYEENSLRVISKKRLQEVKEYMDDSELDHYYGNCIRLK